MGRDRPVAVVTGAASGIGRSLALAFAGRGWAVVAADVEPDPLAAVVEEVGRLGAPGLAVTTDVTSEAAVGALAEEAVAAFGPVDVACLNAGVNAYGFRTWEVPAATWRWVWEVNVLGVAHGIAAFVPAMVRADRGHVFATSSVAGLAAGPQMAPYAASKHAVVAMADALRQDLAEVGSAVRVSVVLPALVATAIGSSERTWPERLGAARGRGPAAEAYAAALEGARREAPGPEVVADAVLAAVDDGRFLVFPGEGTEERARAGHAAVLTVDDDPVDRPSWF